MKRYKFILVLFTFHFSLFTLNAQHYALYGVTSSGGRYSDGVLFRFDPFSGKDSVLFNFNGSDGNLPGGLFYLKQNGLIYGASEYGGSDNDGVLYNYDMTSGIENTLINFNGLNGANPIGGSGQLINDSGILFGTTGNGGLYNAAVIYRYNPISNTDSVVFNFNDTDGVNSYAGLLFLNDTFIIGITGAGGLYPYGGVIYSFNPITNIQKILYNINPALDGGGSQGSFIKTYNGLLYALTPDLGPGGGGTLISFNLANDSEKTLVSFNNALGMYPFGDVFLATDSLLYGVTALGGANDIGTLFSYNIETNQCKVVINFDTINGSTADGGDVIEDTVNKILYGVTELGGKYNAGVIFSYNLITKRDSVLFSFNGTDGANPQSTLLLIWDSTASAGVNEVKEESGEVKVYPNPTSGVATLVVSDRSLVVSKMQVEVLNVFGQKVYSAPFQLPPASSTCQINLSSQPEGVYFYRVFNEAVASPSLAMTVVGQGKIIIQK